MITKPGKLIFCVFLILSSCATDDESLLKAQWLADFFNEVKTYDDIYALSYWHEDFDNTYLKINSSANSLLAFKESAGDSLFISRCKFSNNKLVPVPEKKYLAAFPDFDGPEDNVLTSRITDYESLVGKKIAWAYFSNNWYDKIEFPTSSIYTIIASGKTPFIRLMARSEFEEYRKDPVWDLMDIINGVHDSSLIAWAQAAKNIPVNMLAEFGTEMNGDWFSWNGSYYGGGNTSSYGDLNYPDGPEIFRDAYRHIIDVCTMQGANNITWFFHFDVHSSPEKWWNDPIYYYPGDDYIDWLGVSTYGPFEKDEISDELEPAVLLEEAHQKFLGISRHKPFAILEFGVTEL